MNPRPSGYEPDCRGPPDLRKYVKRLFRTGSCFASLRVLSSPIAPSRAMDEYQRLGVAAVDAESALASGAATWTDPPVE